MDPYIYGAIGTGGGALISQNSEMIKNQRKLLELQEKIVRENEERELQRIQALNQVVFFENERNRIITEKEESIQLQHMRSELLSSQKCDSENNNSSNPLIILKKRYIQGEISDEEFLRKKKILEGE